MNCVVSNAMHLNLVQTQMEEGVTKKKLKLMFIYFWLLELPGPFQQTRSN